jgi:hypothetical protein
MRSGGGDGYRSDAHRRSGREAAGSPFQHPQVRQIGMQLTRIGRYYTSGR